MRGVPRLRSASSRAASSVIGVFSLRGVDADDLGQFLDGVELQMLVHLEAVAHRAGQHAAARRRADQRESLQVHRDRAGVDALAEHDVDAKILHRRVDELLDHARHAMDFVDEEDRAFLDVGQKRQQVGGLRQGRPAGHLDRRAQFVRQHRGERGLAEPRRAVEENVAERLLEFLRRVDRDRQPPGDCLLADHLAQELRPQRRIALAIVVRYRSNNGCPSHTFMCLTSCPLYVYKRCTKSPFLLSIQRPSGLPSR